MTRDRFIRKWLGYKAEYTKTNRDKMRNDLDAVIDYHLQSQQGDAVDFIKWIEKNSFVYFHKFWISIDYDIKYSSEELYELFLKEKGEQS